MYRLLLRPISCRTQIRKQLLGRSFQRFHFTRGPERIRYLSLFQSSNIKNVVKSPGLATCSFVCTFQKSLQKTTTKNSNSLQQQSQNYQLPECQPLSYCNGPTHICFTLEIRQRGKKNTYSFFGIGRLIRSQGMLCCVSSDMLRI